MVLPRSQLDASSTAAEPQLAIVRDDAFVPATEADLDALQGRLRKAQRELETDREELDSERERFERRRQRMEERERQLEKDQERLTAEQAEVEALRRNAAKSPDVTALKAECERLRKEQADWREEQGLWRQAQTAWLAERDNGAKKLAAVQAQLAQATAALESQRESGTGSNDPSPADARRAEDLQRRFELAVQDVRELKRRNGDLEEKLAEMRTNGGSAKPADSSLDWEAQKRRLLAALDDDGDAKSADNRLTLEGAIHITDEVVAQRDRELADLKSKLADFEGQSQRPGVNSEIAEILDRDAVILEERAKLAELQEMWREKLKQAEVDLSIERAKIARERADIEEKLQAYAEEKDRRIAAGTETDSPTTSQKPSRGRWLARLGLKDDEG